MAFFSVLEKRAARSWRSVAWTSLSLSKYMSTTSSPGLMLPPDSEGGYKFFSLAEKRVLTIGGGGGGGEESELVGSSHGWVTLLNRRNNDLFLSNPLSGREIRLPGVDILGDPKDVSVFKLILSSSPDEHGCRAMMTYGLRGERESSSRCGKVAFCSPGRSWRWTEISNLNFVCCDYTYEDMVCSKGILTCIKSIDMDSEFVLHTRTDERGIVNWDMDKPVMDHWNMGIPEIEYWDLACPPKSVWDVQKNHSLRLIIKNNLAKTPSWLAETMKQQQQQRIQILPHLVCAQHSDQLYLVIRLLAFKAGPTLGFVVLKVNKRSGLYEVVDDLNGQAMFVGINHSFVVSASDFPYLTSNSIYFTHANACVYDTAIFDYENKAITPIITGNYSSPPIWFYLS